MTDHETFAAERVMIIAAPNGARRVKRDHPAIPLTTAELADAAASLEASGTAVLHLHVRDSDGRHTLDMGAYLEAIAAIRGRVGEKLVLQVTTEAVGMYRPEEQMALVRELEPEAVSLALREVCPRPEDEKTAAAFFAWLVKRSIWPQYILYSVEDLVRFDDMRRRGVFADGAPFVLFVLGRYADGAEGSPADLEALLAAVDCSAFPWAVCCFGPRELDVMLVALERGGHVRIGFENNLLMADGGIAPDNAALVRQFTAAAGADVRRPASAAETRTAFLPRARSSVA